MDVQTLGLDNLVTKWGLSQGMLHYGLFVAMLSLGAAFVFFLSEKEQIAKSYRSTLTTSAIICGVAAVAYYFITAQYAPGKPFPTAVRYVDWTVTTPLLLIKYAEMLKVRGYGFAWKLILADLFMIVTGYIGELYGTSSDGHWTPLVANGVQMHYVWGFISTLGYAAIVYVLLTEGNRLAKAQPLPIQHGIKSMNLYILTLWGVYPIVYVLEGMAATNANINLDWANLASAVADIINKVGFGVTAYLAVRALSGDDQESPTRVSTPDAEYAGR